MVSILPTVIVEGAPCALPPLLPQLGETDTSIFPHVALVLDRHRFWHGSGLRGNETTARTYSSAED